MQPLLELLEVLACRTGVRRRSCSFVSSLPLHRILLVFGDRLPLRHSIRILDHVLVEIQLPLPSTLSTLAVLSFFNFISQVLPLPPCSPRNPCNLQWHRVSRCLFSGLNVESERDRSLIFCRDAGNLHLWHLHPNVDCRHDGLLFASIW